MKTTKKAAPPGYGMFDFTITSTSGLCSFMCTPFSAKARAALRTAGKIKALNFKTATFHIRGTKQLIMNNFCY